MASLMNAARPNMAVRPVKINNATASHPATSSARLIVGMGAVENASPETDGALPAVISVIFVSPGQYEC